MAGRGIRCGLKVSQGCSGTSEGGEWLNCCRTQMGTITHVHAEPRLEVGFVNILQCLKSRAQLRSFCGNIIKAGGTARSVPGHQGFVIDILGYQSMTCHRIWMGAKIPLCSALPRWHQAFCVVCWTVNTDLQQGK